MSRTPLPAAFSDPGEPRKKRNGLTIRAYLGCCLLCRHGVFQGDDVTRGRGKLLGLMHTGCVPKEER